MYKITTPLVVASSILAIGAITTYVMMQQIQKYEVVPAEEVEDVETTEEENISKVDATPKEKSTENKKKPKTKSTFKRKEAKEITNWLADELTKCINVKESKPALNSYFKQKLKPSNYEEEYKKQATNWCRRKGQAKKSVEVAKKQYPSIFSK